MTIEEIQILLDELTKKGVSSAMVEVEIITDNVHERSHEVTGEIGRDILGRPILLLTAINDDGDF